MFPTQSLLQSIDCPDHLQGICERVSCPFGHSKATKGKLINTSKRRVSQLEENERGSDVEEEKQREKIAKVKESSSSSKISLKTSTSEQIQHSRRPETGSEQNGSNLYSITKSIIAPRNAYDPSARAAALNGEKVQQKSVSSVNTKKNGNVEASTLPSSSKITNHEIESLTAPLIARNTHPVKSKVTLSDRQGCLRPYFTSFTTLYAPLIPPMPKKDQKKGHKEYNIIKRLAHQLSSEDALESELKIFKTSNTNPLTYRNSVRTDLVGVTRRTKEDKEAQKEGKDCLGTLGIEAQKLIEDSIMTSEEGDLNIEEVIMQFFRSSHLIGTNENVKGKTKKIQERKESMMIRKDLEESNLMANHDQLLLWDYPLPQMDESEIPDSIKGKDLQSEILESWGLGGTQTDLIGEKVECIRCRSLFTVQAIEPESEQSKACCYHWGKRRFVREGNSMRGPRVPRWTCCDSLDEETAFSSTSLSQIAQGAGLVAGAGETSSPNRSGCVRGPHVFKEEETKMLHRREAFISTNTLLHQSSKKYHGDDDKEIIKYDILAFDCELIFTTAGMSLARLTVLNENGKVVLDRFVRPKSAILDYNTRFSGIRPKDIPEEDAVNNQHSLESAREALGKLMKPETIFIGHGLENDLRAIRLVHTRLVDSVLLYPHKKGMPFRMSLRELALTYLKRHIQMGDEQNGHDAEEDARAALDLVRLKYREYVEDKKNNRTNSVENSSTKIDSSKTKSPISPSIPQKLDGISTANLFLPKAKRK